jgi:hypothetical protein
MLRRWSTGAALLALFLGTWVALRGWCSTDPAPVPYELRGAWIASPAASSVTQFRRRVLLSGPARSAWLAVASDDEFEVIVNGRSVGRWVSWRGTHPFQGGLSERGQRLRPPSAIIDLNFPREYEWGESDGHLLPVFFDLGTYLVPGENCLAIEVTSRRERASVAFDGEVDLWSGEILRLDSDESVRASIEPPPEDRAWTFPGYPDVDWPAAVPAPRAPGGQRVLLDPELFQRPFAGRWLGAPVGGERAVWFRGHWRLDGTPARAWLRILCERPHTIFVNDVPVRVREPRPHDADAGEWTIGVPRLTDLPVAAELLDDDEVGSLFAGARLALPTDQERMTAPEGPLPFDLGQRAPTPPAMAPGLVPPKELERPPPRASFDAYGIRQLLHAGDNEIAVRLSLDDGPLSTARPPRVAFDGAAVLEAGSESRLDGERWTASAQDATGQEFGPSPALLEGSAAGLDHALPRLVYRGEVSPPWGSPWRRALCALLCALGVLGLWALPRALTPDDEAVEGTRWWMFLLPSAALFVLLLLDASWRERDDALGLLAQDVWRAAAAGSFLLAAGVAFLRAGRARGSFAPGTWLRALPGSRAWPFLVAAVVVACVALRFHAVAEQPFDPDEDASVEAGLAIAKTGLPRYTPEVYYTRSPLYHYLLGACVRVFGANVWGLRVLSVAMAAATAWLVYLAGAQLLKSRWVGLVAAALFAIHPYGLFVGHMVRFYQQQQFFCFLTVYCFCRGFVTEQTRSGWRLATVAAFLGATLSQEISVVLAVPLLVALLLFSRRPDRLRELLAVAACAAALVVLDIVVMQTACLTNVEAISPNVEATVAPHFANPLHFLTLFVSYSRLHLALSALLALGLPLLVAGKNARRDRCVHALLVVLVGGVVATNLLVTLEALRYLYWLFPVWLLLGVHAIRALVEAARARGGDDPVVQGWLAPALGTVLLAGVVLSWSPWKVLDAYDTKLLADATSAFAYVRAQLREGDAVATVEPHPPAALLEVGRVDYDVSVPLLNDFVYRRNGVLVDRNAGAPTIVTLEQLEEAMARHERLWLVVDRNAWRSRGQEVLWQYRAARFEAFVRENFDLKHQTFQSAVFLWDARRGRYRTFRQHGRAFL